MAMHNPTGRANYEPNSWTEGGPRADAETGYTSYPEEVSGEKRKIRAELFADHYSQARQFYNSQTKVEQSHIANAITFELSKVETLAIRERVVAHLPNIDEGLAQSVADGLGFDSVPQAHAPRRERIDGLATSDALSILKNGPESFKGRKLGVLVTDGIDDAILDALQEAVKDAGAMIEIVAPTVGGITTAGGKKVAADQKIDGAPSVLYDAVAVLASKEGVETLKKMHPANGFASDAFAHAKFIALSGEAAQLFKAVGVSSFDDGVFELAEAGEAKSFLTACGALRYWDRVS